MSQTCIMCMLHTPSSERRQRLCTHGVSRAVAFIIGTKWEMSVVKVGPLISFLLLHHSDAFRVFISVLAFYWLISLMARGYGKFWLQTCIWGISMLVFFLKSFYKNTERIKIWCWNYNKNAFFPVFFSGISLTVFSHCWPYNIDDHWPIFSSLDAMEGFSPACPWWENVQLNDIWLPGA